MASGWEAPGRGFSYQEGGAKNVLGQREMSYWGLFSWYVGDAHI